MIKSNLNVTYTYVRSIKRLYCGTVEVGKVPEHSIFEQS